jgi:hypothetical protein
MNVASPFLTVETFVQAAKVPRHLLPWRSPTWHMNAVLIDGNAFLCDGLSMSGLHRVSDDGYGGYTVMDDSDREIKRHMAAILAARGRILKTGLGFGCFVRACLLKPEVEHIDVIEIDRHIIDHFGKEFEDNPRVTIHHVDAFKFRPGDRRWDLAWHDIYCDGNDGLQGLHAKLFKRYRKYCHRQGAWAFPRFVSRIGRPQQFVGSPRVKIRKEASA